MAEITAAVLRYAKQNLGRRIGRGECWDLADKALEESGGKCSHDYGKVTPNANYVWGTLVSLANAKSGDIIQYRNFTWTRRVTQKDGSWEESSGEYPHHTAILNGKKGNSPSCWHVYEQNWPANVKKVQLNTVFLKAGTFRMTNQASVTIKLTGRFWIYRPQSK